MAETVWRAHPSLTERVGQIYVAHRDMIFHFLTRQGLPAACAQDITQEVFLKLLITLRDGGSVTSEQAWLYRVAANRAVDYWRRERLLTIVDLDDDRSLADALASDSPGPDHLAQEQQRNRRLAREISRLPKEQRMCVVLRSQGLRYRDIAQVLGIGVSTAADWLLAAVESLRRSVQRSSDE
jgi:RNA polymerase sigma-70 factor (ECF subfamily)